MTVTFYHMTMRAFLKELRYVYSHTSYSAFSSVTFKQISTLSIGVEEGTIQLEGCSHPFHDYLLPFFARNLYL